MLVIPALGRLRQDDRTFVPVGLIPSKYHKKKKEATENTVPSRKAEEQFRYDDSEGSPTHWTLNPCSYCKGPHRLDSRLLPGNLPGPS